MKDLIVRGGVVIALLAGAGFVQAGTLDDFYLQQFGAGAAAAKATSLTVSPDNADQPHCGTPLKKGLHRDWQQLQPATQKALAKQLLAPVLSGESTLLSSHFRIHYATSGSDAPPMTDANLNFIPDWVEQVAATYDQVYSFYRNLGYRLPPTSSTPYDIYLRDLAPQSLYGQTTSTTALPAPGYPNAFGSYMEIDNNFTDSKFINASGGPYAPLQSLQITAAHEFHHAIQYSYNYYFDVWYGEATSTWFEDEKYDSVNQLYNYLPAWFAKSTSSLDLAVGSDALNTGAGYSRWLFNRYLAERFGSGVIRDIWQALAPDNSPGGGADVPMAPVVNSVLSGSYNTTLGAEFFGFAKRVYLRDWSSHTNELARIHFEVPVATYGSYPVNSSTTPQPRITLPHYSFAYFKFTPSSAISNLVLTISKTSGIGVTLFLNRNGLVTEILANSNGTSYTVPGFSQLNPSTDEVALLLANTTSVDNHAAVFSTDGSSLALPEPPVQGTTTNGGTSSSTTTSTGGGGSSSGCFIATAAYGSYLHPQVQLLRDFRDNYLLTNQPGQAAVALYYRISPPIADYIAQHALFRLVVRLLLTPLVALVALIAHPLLSILLLLLALAGLLNLRRYRAYVSLSQKREVA